MSYTEKLYNAALEFTDKQISNILAVWESTNDEALKDYNSLIKLGDSKSVAFASALAEKYNITGDELYLRAYTN